MPKTQDGRTYAFSTGAGMQAQDLLSNPMPGAFSALIPTSGTTVSSEMDAMKANDHPSYLWWFLGIFAVLVVIKFASEHEKSGLDPAVMGVGVYNLVVVTGMAFLGLLILKVALNKWQVPGLTDMANAV